MNGRIALTLALLASATAHRAAAQTPADERRTGGTLPALDAEEPVGPPLPRLRRAVEDGLRFLASRQESSGAFRIDDEDDPGWDRLRVARAPVAVTALGALAFLAYGTSPRRGPHAETLRKALDYLVSCSLPAGSPRAGYIHDLADSVSRMHGHGYATWALAEAYGQYRSHGEAGRAEGERLHVALVAAVARIEACQSRQGGWYYDALPDPSGDENSITITMIQALRAARDAGITVTPEVIDRGIEYVRRTRKADGSFAYSLADQRSSVALTAAAIMTFVAAGREEADAIDQGLRFMQQHRELPGFLDEGRFARLAAGTEAMAPAFPHYERLYVAQAYHRHPTRLHWNLWFPRAAEQILALQADARHGELEGSWPRPGVRPSDHGRVYQTAMNCLVLSIPFHYLPSFER